MEAMRNLMTQAARLLDGERLYRMQLPDAPMVLVDRKVDGLDSDMVGLNNPQAVEMALAHTIGSKTEAAYRRGDMLPKRMKLMAEWADWCGA